MSTEAILGLVALTACDYPSVAAECVQDENGQQTVVSDDHCTDHAGNDNGFFVWGGHQYRYYYGSTGAIGSRPSGGSFSAPEEDEDGYAPSVKTRAGSTISRGGLGGYGGMSGKAAGGGS